MRDSNTAHDAQEEKPLLKQVRFITALTADPEVTSQGKAVANALVFVFWNRAEGYARPGHAKLAQAAGTTVSSVKRGIQSLQERGWLCVQPAYDEQGDPAPNHYYPIWKRADSKAPTGSERPKKARPKPPEPIVFEAGNIRLTASEYADIEGKVGDLAWPFFDDLQRHPPEWSKETWRGGLAVRVEDWARKDDEVAELADHEELVF